MMQFLDFAIHSAAQPLITYHDKSSHTMNFERKQAKIILQDWQREDNTIRIRRPILQVPVSYPCELLKRPTLHNASCTGNVKIVARRTSWALGEEGSEAHLGFSKRMRRFHVGLLPTNPGGSSGFWGPTVTMSTSCSPVSPSRISSNLRVTVDGEDKDRQLRCWTDPGRAVVDAQNTQPILNVCEGE